jgi:uncharacterized protein YicC (UPF0701 family)
MKSMTGYGSAATALGPRTLTVQVSSVNRKTLDLSVSLPDEWESLEPAIGAAVRSYATRGKVHVNIELTGRPGAAEYEWDDDAIAEVLDRLADLAAKRGLTFTPTPELLWQVANAQRTQAELPAADTAKPWCSKRSTRRCALLRPCAPRRARPCWWIFSPAPKRCAGTPRRSRSRASQVAPAYREQLLKRLREAGLELKLDDERVLKEIALFADRCDISEEITRFRSHLDQFVTLLKSNGEIGRKADFILQEIGREVNTTGAKANDLAIAKHVIELKNELERIREQIANVE